MWVGRSGRTWIAEVGLPGSCSEPSFMPALPFGVASMSRILRIVC
jgi:hypothetical protein